MKQVMTIAGLLIMLVIMPILLFIDIRDSNWWGLVLDAIIILLWADWLIRRFKK